MDASIASAIDVGQANKILRLVTDYGVAIVGLIFAVGFLGWLIRYILRNNERREQKLSEFISNDLKHLTEGMSVLTSNITNFSNSVSEAQKYQREEHKEILKHSLTLNNTLSSINNCLNKISENCERHVIKLTRIEEANKIKDSLS